MRGAIRTPVVGMTLSHVDYPDVTGPLLAVIGEKFLVHWVGLALYDLIPATKVRELVEVRA